MFFFITGWISTALSPNATSLRWLAEGKKVAPPKPIAVCWSSWSNHAILALFLNPEHQSRKLQLPSAWWKPTTICRLLLYRAITIKLTSRILQWVNGWRNISHLMRRFFINWMCSSYYQSNWKGDNSNTIRINTAVKLRTLSLLKTKVRQLGYLYQTSQTCRMTLNKKNAPSL